MTHARTVLTTVLVAVLTAAANAGAAPGGIAYIKDRQVWVAKLDGSKKVQLSDGDAWWNTVGQSSTGGIVGMKNEPGKINVLTQFAVWNADGSLKDAGPAAPGTSANYNASLTMPLGLELTADNRGIIYGFSHNPTPSTRTEGYALLPTDTRTTLGLPTVASVRWPSLVAGRLLGTTDDRSIALEDAGGNTQNFSPWFYFTNTAITVQGVQAADDGSLVTVQFTIDNPDPTPDEEKVNVRKMTGLLGSFVDDCYVPAVGKAEWSDIAADGSAVVWADQEGLKVAGAPVFPAGETCTFTSPPVLVAAGATSPALGPIDVDAVYAARNPQPPNPITATTTTTTTTTPTTTTPTLQTPAPGKPPAAAVPVTLSAAKLIGSGATIQVAVGKAGKISVIVTVPASAVGRRGVPVVVATGTASASAAGQLTVALKATKAGKRYKKKLQGKRATFAVKAGGKTTKKTVKLR